MKQKYIFGYGSLVSKSDAARTLGHPVNSTKLATLKGWVRDWGAVIDNNPSHKHFKLTKSHKIPREVLALNIHRPKNDEKPLNPNGVLIKVNDLELSKMDKREVNYKRVNVTNDVVGKPEDSIIYTYVCLPEHLDKSNKHPIIPSSYLHVVLESFRAISPKALYEYIKTTEQSTSRIRSAILCHSIY